jgi:pimeloyl-ACP methyl ester carboxylesterase
MKRIFVLWACVWIFLLSLPYHTAAASCEPDGVQASGSIYRICMPERIGYNNRLVIWAHGFQDATEPVGIPEDQLRPRDIPIQEFVNALGFGFATNSYSKTGLAVREGMADIVDLVSIYSASKGAPEAIYLVGASEGGLITALLIEQRPDLFAGGLAACGPVGDFGAQIGYVGDALATFDYFFPGLIPDQGDPFRPSPALIADWDRLYSTEIRPNLLAPGNRRQLNQWARVAGFAFDPARPVATKTQTGGEVLRYAVLNLNDAAETLGGFPYGNRFRRYSGSLNDAALNAAVPRIAADPAALQEIAAYYTPSGRLERPLVTLHSTRDSLVPYRQERLYIAKTRNSGAYGEQHLNIRTSQFGHCRFTPGEVLLGLATLGAATGESAFLRDVATGNLERRLRRDIRRLANLNGLRVGFSDGGLRIRLPDGFRP